MTPEQIIAVVTALLSAEPDLAAFTAIRAGGADPRYPVTVEACPSNAVPPTEVEGGTVICGRVNLPEDHGKPDGTRIDLAFAVLKARTQSPVPDPVIYQHGGPGGGALTALAGVVHPLFDGYRSRRDVVTFDQRAAGISSASGSRRAMCPANWRGYRAFEQSGALAREPTRRGCNRGARWPRRCMHATTPCSTSRCRSGSSSTG